MRLSCRSPGSCCVPRIVGVAGVADIDDVHLGDRATGSIPAAGPLVTAAVDVVDVARQHVGGLALDVDLARAALRGEGGEELGALDVGDVDDLEAALRAQDVEGIADELVDVGLLDRPRAGDRGVGIGGAAGARGDCFQKSAAGPTTGDGERRQSADDGRKANDGFHGPSQAKQSSSRRTARGSPEANRLILGLTGR